MCRGDQERVGSAPKPRVRFLRLEPKNFSEPLLRDGRKFFGGPPTRRARSEAEDPQRAGRGKGPEAEPDTGGQKGLRNQKELSNIRADDGIWEPAINERRSRYSQRLPPKTWEKHSGEYAEVELARAEGKADLTASARYSHRDSQFDAFGLSARAASPVPLHNRDNILTFGLSIPMFTANRNRGNIEATVTRSTNIRDERLCREGGLLVK